MSIYYNVATDEYPLFIGDVQLIDVSWDEDRELPENIKYVFETDRPEEIDGKHIIELKPEFIGGQWKQKFGYRDLTQEEIDFNWSGRRPPNMLFIDTE